MYSRISPLLKQLHMSANKGNIFPAAFPILQISGSDLCIPRNETARPRYFQNRITMFCLTDVQIHVSMSNLYIPRINLSFLLQPNRQTDLGNI
jgi:hypothetical protein